MAIYCIPECPEGTVPTPPAGQNYLFLDGGLWKYKDDTGTVFPLGGAGAGGFQLLSEKDAANGYAGLDGTGKILVSALPTTVMEYLGAWDANTNSPTLIDGTGDNGDIYRVSVAGTIDLGSGPETYAVGDQVIYNGTIWQKIPAADAVTSVNTQTGVVVLDADDISDATTTNKFVTAADLTNLGNLSGTNSGDVTLNSGTPTQESANLVGQELELVQATTSTDGVMSSEDKTKLDGIIAGAEPNAVDSVNTQTGAVVLDADDIDDTSTTNKFVTAGDLTNLSNLSGTNTGDVTLNAGTDTQESANLVGQEIELVPATGTSSGIVSKIAQVWAGIKTFLAERIIIDSPSATDDLLIGWKDGTSLDCYSIYQSGVGGVLCLMNNADNPQIFLGHENNTTGSGFIDVDNNRPLNLNVLDTGAGTQGAVNIGIGGATIANTLDLTAIIGADNLTLIKTNSTTSWAINAGRTAFFDNWLLFKNSGSGNAYDIAFRNDGTIRTQNGSAGAPAYGFATDSNVGMYLAANDTLCFSSAGAQRFCIEPDGTLSTDVANYETLVTDDDDIPNKKYVDDAVAGVTVPSATETVEGIAEIATQAETDAGTDDTRIVTPLKLKTVIDNSNTFISSIATTPLVTGDQDNYSPAQLEPYILLRVLLDGNHDITGLDSSGFNGGEYVIIKATDADIKFKKNDGGSLAANRFLIDADVTLKMDHSMMFIYDSVVSRWSLLTKD